jgi:hypothetical protein
MENGKLKIENGKLKIFAKQNFKSFNASVFQPLISFSIPHFPFSIFHFPFAQRYSIILLRGEELDV